MRYITVTGFMSPVDREKKGARRAVILGMNNGKVLLAPATTWFERTGKVPFGHVLLTDKSAAYKGSGFNKPFILISIRDAAWFSIDSEWVKNVEQMGVLDTDKDKRLDDNLRDWMRNYDLTKAREFA